MADGAHGQRSTPDPVTNTAKLVIGTAQLAQPLLQDRGIMRHARRETAPTPRRLCEKRARSGPPENRHDDSRPREYASDADRVRAWRARQKQETASAAAEAELSTDPSEAAGRVGAGPAVVTAGSRRRVGKAVCGRRPVRSTCSGIRQRSTPIYAARRSRALATTFFRCQRALEVLVWRLAGMPCHAYLRASGQRWDLLVVRVPAAVPGRCRQQLRRTARRPARRAADRRTHGAG